MCLERDHESLEVGVTRVVGFHKGMIKMDIAHMDMLGTRLELLGSVPGTKAHSKAFSNNACQDALDNI